MRGNAVKPYTLWGRLGDMVTLVASGGPVLLGVVIGCGVVFVASVVTVIIACRTDRDFPAQPERDA